MDWKRDSPMKPSTQTSHLFDVRENSKNTYYIPIRLEAFEKFIQRYNGAQQWPSYRIVNREKESHFPAKMCEQMNMRGKIIENNKISFQRLYLE